MEFIKDTKNNLLKRREIQFVIETESNPGFANVQKVLIEKIKVPEENVAIKFVKNNFGSRKFLVEAFVYDSQSDKERVESKTKNKKRTVQKTEAKI